MSHFKHYLISLMLIMGCALTSFTANAENLQCVNAFFSACAQQKNMETILVNKELMNLTKNHTISSIDKKVLDKINTIGIVTADGKTDISKLQVFTDKYLIASAVFELVMVSNDDFDHMSILNSKQAYSNNSNTFVIIKRDCIDMTVVVINGNITISDIAKLKL